MRELPGHQQGDLWTQHKTGRMSASEMNKLIAYSKTGLKKNPPVFEELADREKYRYRLMIERQTGRRQANAFVNAAMEWGIEKESEAKQLYEKATGQMIIPVGFVLHPTLDCAGASPDGLLDEAIFEVKCPESMTFEKWWDLEGVPEEHQLQMQWQMACCERSRGVFMAYDPRLAEGHRCFFRDLERDNKVIATLESEVLKMDAEVEAMLRKRGLPPTVWDTTGNPVIHHVPESMTDWTDPASFDYLDKVIDSP